jgi:hypothetical protein
VVVVLFVAGSLFGERSDHFQTRTEVPNATGLRNPALPGGNGGNAQFGGGAGGGPLMSVGMLLRLLNARGNSSTFRWSGESSGGVGDGHWRMRGDFIEAGLEVCAGKGERFPFDRTCMLMGRRVLWLLVVSADCACFCVGSLSSLRGDGGRGVVIAAEENFTVGEPGKSFSARRKACMLDIR